MLRTNKVLSILVASILLLAGASAGVGATYFAPTAAAQSAAEGGIPATANLHIHKYIGLPGQSRANGAEQDIPDTYTAAPGVTFYAYEVPEIDLGTLEGWQAARDLQVGDFFDEGSVSNNYNTLLPDVLAAMTTAETGVGGTAEFNGIDTGVYLIVEEPNPTVDGQTLAPAAPFLITVPMTDPSGTGWLDTVHVYPKNQAVDAPVVTVYDPVTGEEGVEADLTGSSLGELIGYQIAGAVPQLGAEDSFSGFVISDRLPVGLGAPSLVSVTLGGEPVPADGYNEVSYQLADGAWVLRVELTGATLAGLTGAPNAPVVVDFTAQVGGDSAATPTDPATLDNQAWILPSAPNPAAGAEWDPASPDVDAGAASNVVSSVYGEIVIDKFGGPEQDRLPGAVFELRRCEGDILVENDLPIRIDGTTTWTTDGTGAATIPGIHLANQGGEPAYEDLWAGNGDSFCLVETEAPDGYALLPEPIPVTVTYGADTIDYVSSEAPVENFEADAGFQLPLTGGVGIWLILGVGALLLILAAVYYAVTRNRTEQ